MADIPTVADVLAAIRDLNATIFGRTEVFRVDILARFDALGAIIAEIHADLQRRRGSMGDRSTLRVLVHPA